MNHIYRLVWNHHTQSMVAVAETAKGLGKNGGKAKTLATAVAGALLALGAGQVFAVDVCSGSGTTTINTTQTVNDNCVLDAGGSLIVQAGGVIATPQFGVLADGVTSSGGIQNTGGTIAGVESGVRLTNIAVVNNGITNAGVISSASTTNANGYKNAAIDVRAGSTITGGVHNLAGGTITGTNSGGVATVASGVHSDAALITDGITNSGLIVGGRGVYIENDSTITGGILNRTGASISGLAAHGIYALQSSITGGITNQSGATISGRSGIGLSYSNVQGGITNAGRITTANGTAGLYLSGSTVSGAIYNSGVISSTSNRTYSAGIFLSSGNQIADGITNASGGTISGSKYGIYVSAGNTVGGVINAGMISGVSKGIYVKSNSTLTGGIANSGVISANKAGAATAVDISHSTVVGNISNSGAITAYGASGLTRHGLVLDASTLTGAIINSGTISATTAVNNVGNEGYDSGIFVTNNALVSNGISNALGGSILSSLYAIVVDAGGVVNGISNAGTITSLTSKAIAIGAGGTVNNGITNLASGRINGVTGIAVVNAAVHGGIINQGTIASDYDGIVVKAGGVVDRIVNTGTLNVSGINAQYGSATSAYGIRIGGAGSAVTAGITNTGLIHVQSNATLAGPIGIYVNGSTITGGINNTGNVLAEGSFSGTPSGVGIKVSSAGRLDEIINSGLITGADKSLDLLNSAGAFTIANTGTLSGAANIGINTLNLNGATGRVIGNTTGTGTVNVNGTFSSEGTFSVGDFNVNSGGLFNMAHGITATTASNSGILNVGSTSQTVTGNYTQSASGIYRMGLTDATSNYGKLNVTGTANVAGGVNVVINGSPTIANGTTIAGVITSTGAMTVTPANIAVTDNSLFYNFTAATVSNPGHALDLITTADSNALVNAVGPNNPAAAGVAQNLQNIFNAGVPAAMQPVFDRLGTMTPAQVSNALSQTLPTLVGAGAQAGINALHSMNKLIQSRVESNQGLSSGEDTPDKYMWVRGFGSKADQDDHNNVSGFSSRTNGFGIGVDAPVNDRVRAGVAITYAKSEIKGNSAVAPNVMDADTYELVGYASYNLDPQTDINYQIDIGQNMVKSTRQIGFMGTTARANFGSLAAHGSVGIGRTFALAPSTNVTPSVRLDYTQMRTEGYTETGAGPLNLMVDASTYKEFLLTGDAKIAHQMTENFKLVGNGSLGYDFLNKQSSSLSAFVGGGSIFESKGLEVSPWVYRTGLGAIYDNKKGVEYSARYDMEGRTSGYLNQTLSAKVRWVF